MNSQKLEGASVRSAALYAISPGAAEGYVGTAFQGLGLGRGANRTHRSHTGGVPQAVPARSALPSQQGLRALNLPGAQRCACDPLYLPMPD